MGQLLCLGDLRWCHALRNNITIFRRIVVVLSG
jgi:hypothetical protein